MHPRTRLVADGPPIVRSKDDYAILMGELQQLVNGTWPDTARPMPTQSYYIKSPTQLHWNAGMQVICYVHGTWNHGITYGTSSVGLHG